MRKARATKNIKEKQVVSPKHETWDRNMGATKVALRFAAAMIQLNIAKNAICWTACIGTLNWSPPNVEIHGLIPPDPSEIRSKPKTANTLEHGLGLKLLSIMIVVCTKNRFDSYSVGNPNTGMADNVNTTAPTM